MESKRMPLRQWVRATPGALGYYATLQRFKATKDDDGNGLVPYVATRPDGTMETRHARAWQQRPGSDVLVDEPDYEALAELLRRAGYTVFAPSPDDHDQ